MVMRERGSVGLKHSLILPIGQPDPLQAEFVIPIERVRDEFVAQQIGVHHTRNLRGMPLLDIGLVGACDSDNVPNGAKLPVGTERSRGRFSGRERRRKQRKNKDKNKKEVRGYLTGETAKKSRRNHLHLSSPV